MQARGFKITVSAPSNIAFIKYWGKIGTQVPMNSSLSMGLSNCYTTTTLLGNFVEQENDKVEFDLYVDGLLNTSFRPKIEDYFLRIKNVFPFLKNIKNFRIETKNTFPHSSGIASSASGFAALSFGLEHLNPNFSLDRAANAARLGSGSALRSVYDGHFVAWSKEQFERGEVIDSIVHPTFFELEDHVLIVSDERKSLSSTAGHDLMDKHPLRTARVEQASHNMQDIVLAMKEGDLLSFGKIVEEEARSLHALIFQSGHWLLSDKTLSILRSIQTIRDELGVFFYFTLDAGKNVHLLTLSSEKKKYQKALKEMIDTYGLQCISNHCASGAKLIEKSYEV